VGKTFGSVKGEVKSGARREFALGLTALIKILNFVISLVGECSIR
jgi:hypothetical protein